MTDGTVNASLPKASNPDALTYEQAMELLAARRDMAPAPKRGAFGSEPRPSRQRAARKKKTA